MMWHPPFKLNSICIQNYQSLFKCVSTLLQILPDEQCRNGELVTNMSILVFMVRGRIYIMLMALPAGASCLNVCGEWPPLLLFSTSQGGLLHTVFDARASESG